MSTIERHSNGSTTERTGEQSVTRHPNGEVIESSKPVTSWPVPNIIGPWDIKETVGGDGNVINRQPIK